MKHLVTASFLFLASMTAHGQGQVEKILGYQPTQTGVIFQVASGGCTHRDDFMSLIEWNGTHVAEITLVRLKPDNCHPLLPRGERFKFSHEDLGLETGDRFIIMNPNGVVHSHVW